MELMGSSALCFRFPAAKHAHNDLPVPSCHSWQTITYLYLWPCSTEGGAHHAGRHPGHSGWNRQSCLFFQAAGWRSCSKWVFSVPLRRFFFGMFYGLISSMIVNLRDRVTPGEHWAASLKHCCIPSASPASTQPLKQDWQHGMVGCVLCCAPVACASGIICDSVLGEEMWQRISTTLPLVNSQLFPVQCLTLPDLSLHVYWLWNARKQHAILIINHIYCIWIKHTRSH